MSRSLFRLILSFFYALYLKIHPFIPWTILNILNSFGRSSENAQRLSLRLKYLVRSLFWSERLVDPLIEIDRYCAFFDNQYGPEHPVFYRGKLSQVGIFRAFALFTIGIILGFDGCPAWSSTAIYLFAREELPSMWSLLPVRTSKQTGRQRLTDVDGCCLFRLEKSCVKKLWHRPSAIISFGVLVLILKKELWVRFVSSSHSRHLSFVSSLSTVARSFISLFLHCRASWFTANSPAETGSIHWSVSACSRSSIDRVSISDPDECLAEIINGVQNADQILQHNRYVHETLEEVAFFILDFQGTTEFAKFTRSSVRGTKCRLLGFSSRRSREGLFNKLTRFCVSRGSLSL